MSYTVTQREGCTFITGSVPVSQLTALMSAAGKGQVVSDNLARLAGVQFAWGLPADVDALEDKIRAENLSHLTKATGEPLGDVLSLDARRWLSVGEQGLSSCAIFWKLTGAKPDYLGEKSWYDHPDDPADLRRCLLLLDQVPELQGRITEMAGCSPEWDALASNWTALDRMLTTEIPDWRNPKYGAAAPKTYAMMREILRSAKEAGDAHQN